MIDKDSLIAYEDRLSEIYSVLDFVFQKQGFLESLLISIRKKWKTKPTGHLKNAVKKNMEHSDMEWKFDEYDS